MSLLQTRASVLVNIGIEPLAASPVSKSLTTELAYEQIEISFLI